MPSFMRDFKSFGTGELAGAVVATPMPNIKCGMVAFKAAAANTGKVYVGGAGVTRIDGVTDTTTGWELSPGEETGYLPASNLNQFSRICDNAGDELVYMYWI